MINDPGFLNLEKFFEKDPIQYEVIKDLVSVALCDSDTDIIICALNQLKEIYLGMFTTCYVEEGLIFLEGCSGKHKPEPYFLSKVPKWYDNKEVKLPNKMIFDLRIKN